MHTDGALLSRGQFLKRADVQLGADIELSSTFVENLLDGLALLLMLLPVFVLTILVAIPNALAGPALHEGITRLFARRAELGRGLVMFGFIILSFHRLAERQGAELVSSSRSCTVLFR